MDVGRAVVVGCSVGRFVGSGFRVGMGVGLRVGLLVGSLKATGAFVGLRVGRFVGSSVGFLVPWPAQRATRHVSVVSISAGRASGNVSLSRVRILMTTKDVAQSVRRMPACFIMLKARRDFTLERLVLC